jgi:hypothetical protein
VEKFFFVIEVLNAEKEKNLHQMDASEKVGYAEARRERGKAAFEVLRIFSSNVLLRPSKLNFRLLSL